MKKIIMLILFCCCAGALYASTSQSIARVSVRDGQYKHLRTMGDISINGKAVMKDVISNANLIHIPFDLQIAKTLEVTDTVETGEIKANVLYVYKPEGFFANKNIVANHYTNVFEHPMSSLKKKVMVSKTASGGALYIGSVVFPHTLSGTTTVLLPGKVMKWQAVPDTDGRMHTVLAIKGS